MVSHCLCLIFSLHLHQIGCNSLLKYSTKFIELVGVGVEPLLEDVCAWMTRQLCVLSAIAGLVLATTIFFLTNFQCLTLCNGWRVALLSSMECLSFIIYAHTLPKDFQSSSFYINDNYQNDVCLLNTSVWGLVVLLHILFRYCSSYPEYDYDI